MKKRLRRLYWQSILITVFAVFAVIILTGIFTVNNTRNHLTSMLKAAARWTLASNEDLPALAKSIAGTSPSLRVTFLLDSGVILGDSLNEKSPSENQGAYPEIIAAGNGEIGENLRLSEPGATLVLYMAEQISPQLILRVSYPVMELGTTMGVYGLVILLLILVLYLLQRKSIARISQDHTRQLDEILLLMSGEAEKARAVFPEYQPALDAISYRSRRLREDYREVVNTLELRNSFVANASHELRSPLTSIRGFAEMLKEGMAQTPEEEALYIQTILQACDRMLAVIEDILKLSRAEQADGTPAPFLEAAPIAEEICHALSPMAAEKKISLLREGNISLPVSEKDLWEILYNLTDNGIRYGKEGGFVRIFMEPGTILVEDDGVGIPAEHLGHIFEQFYRVDETRNPKTGGTGLGLSIVKAITERIGGTICVSSEPGEGTRFLLRFPEGSENV